MIAKDEEDMLGECLSRAKPIVDEMIVVDTGSSDRTREIARSIGAMVFDFLWQDDFSQARNFSLQKAKGEWILVLDADEFISPTDLPTIQALTEGNGVDGYRLCQRSYMDSLGQINWHPCKGEYEEERDHWGYVTAHLVRLFRNDPQIYFQGKLHEVVEPVMAANGKKWVSTEIPLHHYGFLRSKVRLEEKTDAYEKLGRIRMEDTPDDPRSLHDLGVQMIKMGQFEDALAVLEKAYRLNPTWAPVLFNLGFASHKLGDDERAIQYYQSALNFNPEHQGALSNLGLLYQNRGQLEDARKTYEICLDKYPEYLPAILNMSTLLSETKRLPEAIQYLEKARTLCPSHVPVHRALAAKYKELGDCYAAESAIMRWIELDTNNALEGSLLLAEIHLSRENWDFLIAETDRILQLLDFPRNIIVESFHGLAEIYSQLSSTLADKGRRDLATLAETLTTAINHVALFSRRNKDNLRKRRFEKQRTQTKRFNFA